MTRAQQCVSGAALYLLLGLTLLLYWPGLKGPLILDDISNLGRLQNIGPIHDASGFFRFIFSNSSAYPSRPLSYASFLINDLAWPLYVPAHKYTNVLIHLINGVLVFWLAWLLCGLSQAGVPDRGLGFTDSHSTLASDTFAGIRGAVRHSEDDGVVRIVRAVRACYLLLRQATPE